MSKGTAHTAETESLWEAVQDELLACYGEGEDTDWPWLNDLTDVVVGLIKRHSTAAHLDGDER